jgi:hypothetical protein
LRYEEEAIMTARFMKSCLVLILPLAFVLATPLVHAGFWRSSQPESPKKKVTATKPGTTTKRVATAKPVATTKTGTTATRQAAVARPSGKTVTRQTTTARETNTAAREATSVGAYGQTVYHSVHDWEPGSLSGQSSRSASADSGRRPHARGGAPRERAVEVNDPIPIP